MKGLKRCCFTRDPGAQAFEYNKKNPYFSLSIKKSASNSKPVCTKYVLATNRIIASHRTKSAFEIKQQYQQESVSQVCISLHL